MSSDFVLRVPRLAFRHLCSRLIEVECCRKREVREDCVALFLSFVALNTKEGKVTLNVERLRTLVGRNQFDVIRDMWISIGLGKAIDKYGAAPNGSYRAGEYARSYSVKRTGKVFTYHLVTKPAKKRLVEFYEAEADGPILSNSSKPLPDAALPQRKFLMSGRISVDFELAELIHKHRGERECEIDRLKLLCTPGCGHWMTTDRYQARVFHIISNIPKEYRAALRFDGKPLFDVDVSNCQPLLFATMMKEECLGYDEEFLRDTRAGTFYQRLADEMQKSKDQVKNSFVTALNEDVLKKHRMPIWQAFGRIYPKAHNWISGSMISGEETYMHYAKKEAEWIFPIVNHVLSLGIPALSIHDAILTTEEHTETVRELLEQVSQGTAKVSRCLFDPTQEKVKKKKRQRSPRDPSKAAGVGES